MMAGNPLVDEITPDEVLSQLERILADERFVSAERNSRFLRQVVERTLEGKSSEIKEVVIATEIYGRSSNYDPKVDSIVRVEATRLRAKLQSYYERQGTHDPIRITIPKGSYVPRFERLFIPEAPAPELQAPPETDFAPHKPQFPIPTSRPVWVVIGVLTLIPALWIGMRPARVAIGPSQNPHPDALVAWQEGTDLLRQDPNSAVSEKGMPPTLARAIERYEYAVARDPSFAKAWASLVEAYDYASVYVGRDREEDARRAETAARKAIALDQNLAAGHAMLGLVLYGLRFDFEGAEKAYQRTIQLDPRSTYAIIEYTDLLRITGRLDEAETQIRNARALQPGLPVLAVKQAEIQLDRQQPDAAIATLNEALRLRHDVRRAHVALGVAWEAKGEYEKALSCYRQALAMNPQDRRALPALGYLLGVLGRRDEAREIALRLEDMTARVRNCAFQVAMVYAGLQDHEKAIFWLERAHRTKQAAIPHLSVEYRFRSLHRDPRVQSILQDLGLKPLRERRSSIHAASASFD